MQKTDAMKEREAVVAWLRGNSAAMHSYAANVILPLPDRLMAEIMARRDDDVAAAIERAEHLKEGR